MTVPTAVPIGLFSYTAYVALVKVGGCERHMKLPVKLPAALHPITLLLVDTVL